MSFNMTTAEALPNGAVILQRERHPHDGWIVLCFWRSSAAQFVTWRCDDAGNANWGHYFRTATEAAADYEARCNDAVKRGRQVLDFDAAAELYDALDDLVTDLEDSGDDRDPETGEVYSRVQAAKEVLAKAKPTT